MPKEDILTNDFRVTFDVEDQSLLVRTVVNGVESRFPIRLRLQSLQQMGATKASEWVGQTLMLLVPTLRKELYGLKEDE
jgi:predicted thioredoxin/glutaredoxin